MLLWWKHNVCGPSHVCVCMCVGVCLLISSWFYRISLHKLFLNDINTQHKHHSFYCTLCLYISVERVSLGLNVWYENFVPIERTWTLEKMPQSLLYFFITWVSFSRLNHTEPLLAKLFLQKCSIYISVGIPLLFLFKCVVLPHERHKEAL